MLALAHPSLAARALAARRLAATLAFALLLLGAPASANQKPLAPSKSEPKFQPAAVDGIAGEYIVVLEGIPTATRRDGAAVTSRVRNTAEMLTARYGGEIQRSFAHAMTGVVVRMGEAQARLLAQDPDVAYVSQNRLLTIAQEAAGSCFRPSARGAQGTGRALVEAPAAAASSSQVVDCPVLDPRDPSYDCDGNWGLDRIDQVCPPLDGFYDQPATGAGVHAYVVDSGIRSNHVEFAGRLGNGVNAAVPVGHPNRFDVEDCNPIGHGTHVAGILGGTFSGVAKGVTLHPVKRVDECGPGDPIGGDEGSLIDAFDWVIANHQAPALVSLSSNARVGWSAAAQAAADRLIAAGIPLVQSAGNRGRDACQFTLRGSGTITVGGSDLNDEQANDGRWVREEDDPSFDAFCGVDCESNFGSCVDLWAPAGHIVSADRGSSSGTCRLSGTSMAAPHVAGAVALYLQGFVGGKLPSPSSVRAAIVGGATRGVLDDDPASPHRIFPGSPNRLLDVHRRGGGPGTCAPNHAPVASWIHSGTGLDRTLDGSRSTDDRGIVEYRWSLPGDVVKYGQVVEHLFPGYGSHFVSLTVTDADGVSHTSIPRSILLSPPTVTPREGLWHNPARSGSGFDFYANTAGNYTLLWYTYTPSGKPIWYITGTGPKSSAIWAQSLYKATWNGSSATLDRVGNVRLHFDDDRRRAWFSWILDGQAGGEPFEHRLGGWGRSGIWYPPDESGWGIQVSESADTVMTHVTLYDGSQPRWVQGETSPSPDAWMQVRWHDGPGLCPSCTGSTPPTQQGAGAIRLRITGGSSITGLLSTFITLPSGRSWSRNSVEIRLLTDP